MVHLVNSTFPSPPQHGFPLLQTYAEDICSAVKTISTYCTSEGLPHPSFDPRASGVTIPSTAPLLVQNARQTLVASAAGIQRLATEPTEYLPNLAIYVRSTPSLLAFMRERSVSISKSQFPLWIQLSLCYYA